MFFLLGMLSHRFLATILRDTVVVFMDYFNIEIHRVKVGILFGGFRV